MLNVAGLESGYGHVQVLYGISLSVAEGEFVAVLGSNGAGKTTLLRCLAGLHPSWKGKVEFAGADITVKRADQRVEAGIVLVPEGRQIFPAMTVQENLSLGAYSRRARKDSREREAWLYQLFPRLAERRNQRAGTLSGGEQQMLAIARGLMSNPRLLLLDEPSLGLAPVVLDQIFARLEGLRGVVTVILVEQDATRALQVSDRAYVLEQGEITLEGAAASIAEDQRLRAAYLGR